MANQDRILMITVKVTLTKASSGEEVMTDFDVLVGCREEYHYVSQEHVTCVYNAEDDDITLFHKGEPLVNKIKFSSFLPSGWNPDIDEGSLLQVRVKGFKTYASVDCYIKLSEIELEDY